MKNKLFVCSSPHLRDNSTTQSIMLDVLIALLPATVAGILFFGLRAAAVIAITIGAALLSEYLMRKVMKREQTVGDLSAVVTGLLLAMNYPATIPFWIAAIGGIIAIVIVKQLFGGIGQNFMNPALGARVILVVSWAKQMTGWVPTRFQTDVDLVTYATPLGALKEGSALASYMDMFIGNIGGCIGETSAIALLLGGIYLLVKRIITIEIPFIYIGTVAILSWILGPSGAFTGDVLYHILGGGLMIGAFFMATDYATSPITRKGRMIFAFGCGLFTIIFRLYTNMPEGVSFAIILMNIVVPLIDRYTIPVSFGGGKNVA